MTINLHLILAPLSMMMRKSLLWHTWHHRTGSGWRWSF